MGKAKQKQQKLSKPAFIKVEEQTFSFDTDANLFISELWYTIRQEIRQMSIDMSENKMCIPRSIVVEAANRIGLGELIKKIPQHIDMNCE